MRPEQRSSKDSSERSTQRTPCRTRNEDGVPPQRVAPIPLAWRLQVFEPDVPKSVRGSRLAGSFDAQPEPRGVVAKRSINAPTT